jgi:hypothetical protein
MSHKLNPEDTPVTLGTRYAPSWAELYPFTLAMEDRRRHMYLVGQTGTGKSTLLKDIIKQDIWAGRGVGYIDPHGQDAEEILRSIPSWRADDVVYFNAADFAYPMAWNLLSSDRLDPADRDRVASIIVSGFQGIFGNSWGPNLEYVLLGCLHTLLARERTSILGVPRLITERDYRAHVLQVVHDPGVRMFWKNFAKQEAEHKDATTSVINKVGRLFLSPTMRNIFGQPVNKIHPRQIMDEKKIFIVNLAKGAIGDDAARIIGALLIAQFFSASLTRRDIPEAERADFSLVIDEFPSFSTTVIANILSEARKYRMNVVLANQFLGQLDETTEQAIFGNPGAVVSFRVGEQDAALLAKHYGGDYKPQHFSNLDNFTVCVKHLAGGIAQDPFIGFTHIFEPPALLGDTKVRYLDPESIVRQSRRQYAERRDVVAAKIERWMTKPLATSVDGTRRKRSVDDELRRHAAARPKHSRRAGPGSGFKRIGELLNRPERRAS